MKARQRFLREVNSLKSMVDEFAKFARLPNVLLETGNLNDLINQTVMLYEDRVSDVKIETNLAENLPETLIDKEQLKRVFVNLIDNAIEVFDKDQNDQKNRDKNFLRQSARFDRRRNFRQRQRHYARRFSETFPAVFFN